MDNRLKFGLSQGALLAGVGLVCGVLSGFVGLLVADGAEPVANAIATLYLVLVLLFPALLAFWTWASLDDEDRVHYRSLSGAIGLLLVGSLLGSVAGTLFFMVTAINMPVIFSGENNLDLRLALMAAIGWSRSLLVVAVTVATSVVLAFWAYRRVASQP